ncbi:MAG TPA: prenyltransferase [Methylotenera sp.]|nr:prenyltransferase [Methylotenera sp.]HPH05411.1 prenyltransferase [Methylotenera sp.]HPN01522.1 prenyltransferase [Methylotenera sp.]
MKIINEPLASNYVNVFKRYFFATRPAFLLATLAACLLGFASVNSSGIVLKPLLALVTLLLALLMHAAVNVLNDYFDALNGTDDVNVERVYPFTGGSRFIQNGILTRKQTAQFGYALLACAMLGGLWLVLKLGFGLLLVGGLGVLVGWAYSATPFKLNSRGLGEFCVLIGFLGIIIGADFVQRGVFSWQPVMVGLPYALLVTNLLFINQFPDNQADISAGKLHWVARLSPAKAVAIYPAITLLALAWLVIMVKVNVLPMVGLLAMLPLIFSLSVAGILKRNYLMPAKLRPAIQLTLVAMLGHALILTAVLFWNAR